MKATFLTILQFRVLFSNPFFLCFLTVAFCIPFFRQKRGSLETLPQRFRLLRLIHQALVLSWGGLSQNFWHCRHFWQSRNFKQPFYTKTFSNFKLTILQCRARFSKTSLKPDIVVLWLSGESPLGFRHVRLVPRTLFVSLSPSLSLSFSLSLSLSLPLSPSHSISL